MKKLLVVLVVIAGSIGIHTKSWAQEEAPALGNNPPVVVSITKSVVNALQPGYDALYNIRDGQWEDGWSASMYNLKSREYLLASARLGYGTQDQLLYASLRADLPGISRRFVPQTIRGIATMGYLDLLWKAVGTYGVVGPWVGYSFHDDAIGYGVTLGGKVSF